MPSIALVRRHEEAARLHRSPHWSPMRDAPPSCSAPDPATHAQRRRLAAARRAEQRDELAVVDFQIATWSTAGDVAEAPADVL